jgi:4-hydroxybenzoate polyprenyltransferase
MSLASNIQKILFATRLSDWRLSFVPFIIGTVYFWITWFKIPFSFYHLTILFLSLCTSFGFAAFGYFINEFFDKDQDAKAGKINKLSTISTPRQFLLFLFILLLTFCPWLILPSTQLSFLLITTEIALFFLYSLPLLRLKNNYFLAPILDASYAYLVPAILSFHTFSLLTTTPKYSIQLWPFFIMLFFIGYRNILIHQVNDVLGDIRAQAKSLVQKLGISNTEALLKALLITEISILAAFIFALPFVSLNYLILVFALVFFFFLHRNNLYAVLQTKPFFILKSERQFIDLFYQLWFPFSSLLILGFLDWKWLLLIPIHALLLIKKDYIIRLLDVLMDYLWHYSLRPLFSFILNYLIYFCFRIVGVNLRREKKSAMEYLKSRRNSV